MFNVEKRVPGVVMGLCIERRPHYCLHDMVVETLLPQSALIKRLGVRLLDNTTTPTNRNSGKIRTFGSPICAWKISQVPVMPPILYGSLKAVFRLLNFFQNQRFNIGFSATNPSVMSVETLCSERTSIERTHIQSFVEPMEDRRNDRGVISVAGVPTCPSLPIATVQEWRRTDGFWQSLIAICIPLLLSALEGSVTNTALPTISDALDLGMSFSWVATAFLLASTIFQPLYGQLGDLWGRKYPMITAVVVFALGSAISGGAHSGAVLILGRVVQGLGVGGIDLFSEMVLCDIVPLRSRGPYLAIKHAVFAVGTALGPLLGGVFAEHGWRWCFLINIPICVVSVVIMCIGLQVETRRTDTELKDELKKVDIYGTLLLTGSVIMILAALSFADAPYPWTHAAIVIPFVLGSLGIIAFVFFQRSKHCKHPIMPPHIFSNRTTNLAFALTAIHGFATYGFQFYLPPFFQAVKCSSPTASGLQVLPTTLIIVILAAVGGPLLTYWGRYKPIHIIGFSSMALSLCLCTILDRNTPVPAWLAFQLLFASGSGVVVSCMLPAVQVALPETTIGGSAGSWAFLRGTGSLFGVALPGAMFNLRFTKYLPHISSQIARAQLAHGQAYSRATWSYIRAFSPDVQDQIIRGFTESLRAVWIVLAVVVSVGFVSTWFEKEHEMREDLNSAFGLRSRKPTAESDGSAST